MEPYKEKIPIDLDKILLPKKEIHAPGVAQRVNAGALLEQEQNVKLIPTAPNSLSQNSSGRLSAESSAVGFQNFAQESLASPTPKTEESEIKQIQTYKTDIEKVVERSKMSVISIAAAEAARRATVQPVEKTNTLEDFKLLGRRAVVVVGGVALVVLAVGIIFYVFSLFQPTVPNASAPLAPFIIVDATAQIPVGANETRSTLIKNLTDIKDKVRLALGLVERLYIALDAQALLLLLAPTIPDDLLRTVQTSYLLGVHSFDGNQPFLILSIDTYQRGYSGMLAWENTMHDDLSPLFSYTGVVHIQNSDATSTPATSTPSIIQTEFVDAIVENRDARVLKNNAGDILFLWTFLDRSTLVITTNEYTLREVIARLKNAPVIPLP